MRCSICLGFFLCLAVGIEAAEFQAGAARIEVTPTGPIRLSGYAARSTPFESIDMPLYARALVLREGEGPKRVLISVDSIGFPGDLTVERRTVTPTAAQKTQIERALGRHLPERDATFLIGRRAGHIEGYGLILDEIQGAVEQ